jgi:hypothetical protein
MIEGDKCIIIIKTLYVDDLLITRGHVEKIKDLEIQLYVKFKMFILGTMK